MVVCFGVILYCMSDERVESVFQIAICESRLFLVWVWSLQNWLGMDFFGLAKKSKKIRKVWRTVIVCKYLWTAKLQRERYLRMFRLVMADPLENIEDLLFIIWRRKSGEWSGPSKSEGAKKRRKTGPIEMRPRRTGYRFKESLSGYRVIVRGCGADCAGLCGAVGYLCGAAGWLCGAAGYLSGA